MSKKNANRGLRYFMFSLILASVGTLLALSAAEFAYRIYLASTLRSQFSDITYRAVSSPIYQSHPEYGIEHIPAATSLMIQVENGNITRRCQRVVNKDGNIGDPSVADNWENASFRIMAFGDSFTSYPCSPASSWTNYLPSALSSDFQYDVSIKNYGNAGFGVMDMIRKAATKLRHEKPDAIIMAFISNDLNRGRIKYNRKAFQERAKIIYDSTVTDVDLPDFNIQILNAKYLAMSKQILSKLLKKVNTFDRIFIVNRILNGNAFYGLKLPGLRENLFIKIEDFSRDSLMVEDIKRIDRSGVPVMLVHLPSFAEIGTHKYRLSDQEQALLASLKRLAPTWHYVALNDHIDVPEDLASAFLMPADLHPSAKGAKMYAQAIAKVIVGQLTNRTD